MKHLVTIALCLIISGCFNPLSATHNRSGVISYKRIAPFTQQNGTPIYTYSITVTKYMNDDGGNQVADREVDTVYFGDGTKGVAPRVNGTTGTCGNTPYPCGEIIVPDVDFRVKKCVYTITHTYAGMGTYHLSSNDPNRSAGVHNIPSSDQVEFYIDALIIINATSGINSSPVVTNPPIYRAGYQICYYYGLVAVDPDNDSLAYQIVPCRGKNGQAIAGFFQPEAGANGTFNVNWGGVLTWCTPQFIDEYNTAIEIREYRRNNAGNYELIGKVLQDMQIIVRSGQPDVVSPLGIRENSLSETTEIYPNPFNEKLHIDLNANANGPVEISLYSNDGKLVLKQLISGSNGPQDISTSTLKPGLYLLEIKTNVGLVHKKVIKN